MEIFILTFLRLLIPLTIFRWPILGIFASMYFDLQDFNYLTIRTEQDMVNYQTWDKFMDIYYLTIAFITTLRWKEILAKKLSIFLYSYRALGVLILFFFHERFLLVIFPNLFENFFLFYLIFKRFTNNVKLFTSIPITIVIIASIVGPKLIAEYYLHVLLSPSVFNLPRTVITRFFPTTVEDIVLYSLYLGPTLAVLAWRILATRASTRRVD